MVRERLTAAALLARAHAKGYKRGAYVEQDCVKDDRKHNGKTKKNQDRTLGRCVLWQLAETEREHNQHGLPVPTEAEMRERCLRPGVEAPDLVTIKDFFRFYVATSRPQLTTKPTTDSMGTIAEWFFGGFHRVTGTPIPTDDRSEVYGWIRKVLFAENLVVNVHVPKHEFTVRDLTRILLALWTKDDLIFIPERYRVQFTYIFLVYCWTGARIGAFFTGGLRYRDIKLVLQRTSNAPGRLIYRIDQRWVKNNRDPENIVFATALKEHDKLIFDDTAFLLNLALADRALFGFDTLADLHAQQIPAGDNELELRWQESALDTPILRRCTKAGGVDDEPMPEGAFKSILKSTLVNAGYLCAASVHSIRRGLGKKVDELYTEVQRSQHLTQADPRIFGQSYVANTSSVDGQGAFLGEKLDHSHVDYFQGLETFREQGLPCSLPARLEEQIKQDPQLQDMTAEVQRCLNQDPPAVYKAKQRLASYLKSLRRSTLHEHQRQWIQERRDWKVATRGKEQQHDLQRTDLVHSLFLLFPERRRLAQKLMCDDVLTSETRWLAMEDLHMLCTRQFSVLYLPGHQSADGRCPARACRTGLDSLPKNRRNQHVQACMRREIASDHSYSPTEVFYCHHCFCWVVGMKECNEHCQMHVGDLGSKRCGTMTYCYTLVRPAYCPFCLGDQSKPATQRLESWCRDHDLWQHIDEHCQGRAWPVRCPHPLCDVSLGDARDLRFHFIDEHGLSRTVPKDLKNLQPWVTIPATTPHENTLSHNKRKATEDAFALLWAQQEQLFVDQVPKKARRSSLTVAPRLLSDHRASTTALFSPVDVAPSVSSTCTSEGLQRAGEIALCGSGSEPGSEDLTQCQSCDSTTTGSLDNDIFSQFLRSPSPDCALVAITAGEDGRNMLDKVDLSTSGTIGSGKTGSPCEDTKSKSPQAPFTRAGPKIRIRLRVTTPRPMIKLRFSAPRTALPDKQKRQSTSRNKRRGH